MAQSLTNRRHLILTLDHDEFVRPFFIFSPYIANNSHHKSYTIFQTFFLVKVAELTEQTSRVLHMAQSLTNRRHLILTLDHDEFDRPFFIFFPYIANNSRHKSYTIFQTFF